MSVNQHPDIDNLLSLDAVVAVGVSGGKDSQACALAVNEHLNKIGHTGPRVLIHADLGVVEWKDSLPCCERLAAYLGWELIVVKRKAGDMLARWQGRWKNNVDRYVDLECVKLILPWSTPSMRFCTSELKVAIIASALKRLFPGQNVINVTGIRRQESANRAKAPIAQPNKDIVKNGATGFSWNAIIDYTIDQVFSLIAKVGLALHEGYTTYLMSRISCAYCIMSKKQDLENAASCPDNQQVYRDMVDLEIISTFAFQSGLWLGDIAPHLLDDDRKTKLSEAKDASYKRQLSENRIPKHLLYVKGWPTCMPSVAEAQLLASIRQDVAEIMQLQVKYTTANDIIDRYADLMAESIKKVEKKNIASLKI